MTLGLLDPADEEPGAPRPLEGVGVARRGVARAIDLVVLQVAIGLGGAAAYVAASLLGDLLGLRTAAAIERLANAVSSSWRSSLLETALGLVAVTLVHTLCEGLHGSTVGKRVCGITVVSEGGAPAGLLAGLKRSLGFLVDQFAFGLVGVHKIRNSPLQQRVGDEWAGTVVVRLSTLSPVARRSGLRFLLAATAALAASCALGFFGAAAQIRHHAGLAAQDAVEIVAVSKGRARERSRGRELRVAVQVRYALRSAPSGALQLFVLREGEVIPQLGRHPVARGSGSVALKAEVQLPPGGPGRPDPGGLRLVVGLYPERNQDAPSADHALDLGIVECGPRGATREPGELCIV